MDDKRIIIQKNGPYIVKGGVPLSEDALVPSEDGHHMEYRHVRDIHVGDTYRLCRCGRSKHKPFCDNSHEHDEPGMPPFVGREVASQAPYRERTDVYPGDGVYLFDDNRCAYARLCHRRDGDVWTLTEESYDPRLKEEAIAASWHCPTGRLTHVDARTNEVYEQDFEPSIVLLEDVQEGASGPAFVRGGIPLESEDRGEYELHNRYALCRCGFSRNKPFCDAMHISYGFNDGSAAFEGQIGERDTSFKER